MWFELNALMLLLNVPTLPITEVFCLALRRTGSRTAAQRTTRRATSIPVTNYLNPWPYTTCMFGRNIALHMLWAVDLRKLTYNDVVFRRNVPA